MLTSDFERELRAIDPRIVIVPNPNRQKGESNKTSISNVKIDGNDVCPVPGEEIHDEPDPSYFYTFPNGMLGRHKSRNEVIDAVKNYLAWEKTEEGQAMSKETND